MVDPENKELSDEDIKVLKEIARNYAALNLVGKIIKTISLWFTAVIGAYLLYKSLGGQ